MFYFWKWALNLVEGSIQWKVEFSGNKKQLKIWEDFNPNIK